MSRAAEKTTVQLRQITHRTHGRRNGPAVRLMSPSDFGQILKPFVFLDFFDMQGPPFVGDLHPHSGIATLSYLIDGRMDLIDPDGTTVVLPSGGVERIERVFGCRPASAGWDSTIVMRAPICIVIW